MNPISSSIAEKIQQLYAITQELEQRFPGRKFTPDGHLIGSIGEVLAAEHYNLTLLPVGTKTHDATTADGKPVQIKATQTDRIAINHEPEYLIVIKLFPNGSWEEVYNGCGKEPWEQAKENPSNKQRVISLSKLRAIAHQKSNT